MHTEVGAHEDEDLPGAAILVGGHSARMGTDKALLRADQRSPSMLEVIAARLAEAGLPSPLLVTNTPERYAFLGLRMVADDLPGAGPLGGVFTALNHSPFRRVLVVACDMPLLNPDLVRYMASLADDADAIVPRHTDEEGHQRPEPLHAIYSRRCIEPIRRRLERGSLSIVGLLDELSVRYIQEAELRAFDPHLLSFRNINTPQEWAEYLRLVRSISAPGPQHPHR
jgi:molybdopterin-guanine dinucleotide biosynthesis protein A